MHGMKRAAAALVLALSWATSPAVALAHGGEEGPVPAPSSSPVGTAESASSGMPDIIVYGAAAAALVALAAFAIAGFLFVKGKGK